MSGDRPVALVTAASRGIGAACARELSARGWDLALLSRSADVEALAGELGALAVRGSVTEPADLERLVRAALDRHGRLDGVVANTGHPPRGDLLGLPDAAWHDGLDLVLLLAVRLARLVTPAMERAGGGAIVNVSSLWAAEPSPDAPVSSALRAALGNFTRLYAHRYAPAGIRMNCVLPGFVRTGEVREELRRLVPMGRYAEPAEIARVVAFLLSAESSYVTGQEVLADGGVARSVGVLR